MSGQTPSSRFSNAKMTDDKATADATTATTVPAAPTAPENEDGGDMDSEADETRSKLENIKYYASLFLGTVSQAMLLCILETRFSY